MTKPLPRPVDFLIIGAAKCATTWEQKSLSASPGIYMPAPELHFFSREYDKGFDWFNAQFAGANPGDIVGEKSNSYLTQPEAAARIHNAYPSVKMIVQMRDPVQRAYSDYCMLLRRGEVDDDIRRHLDPQKAATERFLNDGRYGHHLTRFYALFPQDQILLLAFDDVATHPERQLQWVADHIGYSGQLTPPLHEKVKDKHAAAVPTSLRRLLAPLRPLLDPVRNTAPLSTMRSLVARPFTYPALPDDLKREIEVFYMPEKSTLIELAPNFQPPWIHVRDRPATSNA
ncbi:Sulfotransferase domain-containing protein [Aliiroseovarius halocynthiae]|uniref:Sulfotransferase domain-containing protein n=1 Tax=Aliiroseovarius halocynthiae TaxID=985055 RepID=A0A545SUJ7_9RHOB|nr:sulfotransferase [Aliiroseovarius halocynthiae]TQV68651.1 sulfotransferase domain-containing protein [Aliiroseovarius halocynthiae]SMR71071.1 Sulfotransferase domain-containing protein [Aliiroseovarius halocynthiae]